MSDTNTGTTGAESTVAVTTPTTQTPTTATESTAQASGSESTSTASALDTLKPTDDFGAFLKAAMADADREAAADETPTATANTTANTATANTAAASTTDVDDEGEPFTSDKEKTSYMKRVERYQEKARAAYEAELFGEGGKLGWAKDLAPEDGSLAVAMLADVRQDPIKSMSDLISVLAQDPERRTALRSWALGLLGIDEDSIPAGNAPERPKGSVATEGGAGVYTDDQVNELLERQARDLRAEMQKELSPFKEESTKRHEQAAKLDAIAEDTRAMNAAAQKALPAFQGLPGFTDNRKAILDHVFKERGSVNSQNIVAKLYEAYGVVVAPKIKELAAQEVITNTRHKAEATTLSPSHTATTGDFDPEKASWEDTIQFFAKGGKK